MSALSFVFLGLTITSSWGNGHATTYRGLLKALTRRGHRVLFLERDLPFYATSRDQRCPPLAPTELYGSLDELKARFQGEIERADLVVVGSYVPEGARAARWALEVAGGRVAFYDIDTPVTIGRLEQGETEHLDRALVPRFDLYLSFTGGPMLGELTRRWGARRVRPLYCAVDPELYYPEQVTTLWDLGYLGTYSADRQGALEELLIEPARRAPGGRFAVAGAQYPDGIAWPANVSLTEHVPPGEHRAFYNAQRFTLNLTRKEMALAGHSPSVRLFEAAACGVPVISDRWPGLEDLFEPGREILVARSAAEVIRLVREMPERDRRAIGLRARERALAAHTAGHRAEALERYTRELYEDTAVRPCTAGADLHPREGAR